jgi:hypothetical protein
LWIRNDLVRIRSFFQFFPGQEPDPTLETGKLNNWQILIPHNMTRLLKHFEDLLLKYVCNHR